ncbi:MAG: hypothetical protein HC840_16270 [Leptolyngbyaceae cyanobacterium RM2_2_4]|nr:hypothetical protein [Leptolyngbyaceae cyanobacterium SM1_4_3]NJN56480.1 hypothetical protein [Leptolyngbyaceae cyanobacterium SL_5_9]NJO50739.1 hypothetical protein [Leptolyngbyaceae cyanobacterium RM2_2_4]
MEAKLTNSPVLEKRIRLPEPDMSNITVLTRQLPNEPILPWHHYDSPWLDSEEELLEEAEAAADEAGDSEDSEQLECVQTDISQQQDVA